MRISLSSDFVFRVFILLTYLGRKSLIAGGNKSSVIEAMVRTLGKLLAPLTNAPSNSNRLDITLIGWVLLFLSVCLDIIAPPPCFEDNHEKTREQGILYAACYIHFCNVFFMNISILHKHAKLIDNKKAILHTYI